MLGPDMSFLPNEQEALVALARERAIEEKGLKFIPLRLKNPRFKQITGAMDVSARPYRSHDSVSGQIQYEITIVGKPVRFQFDAMKGYYKLALLDDEEGHNRAFLASHYYANMWSVEDAAVDAEIRAAADALKEKVLMAPAPAEAAKPDIPEVPESLDDIDAQIAELQKRRANVLESAETTQVQQPGPLDPAADNPESNEPAPTVAQVKRGRGRPRVKSSDLVIVEE